MVPPPPAVAAVVAGRGGAEDVPPLTEREPPPSLDDLGARLEKAREAQVGVGWRGPSKPPGAMSGLGFAMRLAVELVVVLAVAVAIGWFLDAWLDTRPWLMLLFFALGIGAAGLNMYRVVAQMGDSVGFPKPPGETEPPDERPGGTEGSGDGETEGSGDRE